MFKVFLLQIYGTEQNFMIFSMGDMIMLLKKFCKLQASKSSESR